ncbi:hypothetical protein CRG98_013278 [Punica granatum]|uniref:DUF7745 domain-containing protein n=1 Tax=Punica granatum TaxID=22663 RepID=A0A2I0KES6_PUNGR|nr:hypothetical protein CRG98_013278 [Punica granatum]
MDRSHPCLSLDVIITPSADITRLWNTFRPIDRAFLRLIIGDLQLLVDSPIDWTLLRTAISFWDIQHVVFNFQGTELTPTVEEYEALIQRPMPTRDIVVPNQMKGSPHLLQIWLIAHIKPFGLSHPFSYITDERSLIARLLHVFQPFERNYSDWRQFMEDLTPAQFLWAARWNPGSPMAIECPSVVESSDNSAAYRIFPPKWTALLTCSCGQTLQLCSHRGFYESEKLDACGELALVHKPRTAPIPRAPSVSIPNAESSAQAAVRTELQSIREERDRLRCELVDTRADFAEHRELQRELAHARVHIANHEQEIARLSAMLDRARAKKRKVPHP